MGIREFAERHGQRARPIRDVIAEWQLSELHSLVTRSSLARGGSADGTATLGVLIGEDVGQTVLVGDYLRGQTLLDQLPSELRAGLAELRRIDPRDVSAMREELLAHLSGGEEGYLPFNDPRVLGYVNKIKGQIGENIFKEHIGKAAELASSGSQEGWDIAVRQADGSYDYVQVKLYQSPAAVVRHMRNVHDKVLAGALEGVDHQQVEHVYFAVPEDIREEVARLAGRFEGLSRMLYEKSIPISSRDAADLVTEGLGNVGPDQLAHFFDELLGGCVVAASLNSAVTGFLWYKGCKDFSTAVADVATDSALSTIGIGVGLLAESACDTALMAGGIGLAARLFLKRAARSRGDFADFLKESVQSTRTAVAGLRGL